MSYSIIVASRAFPHLFGSVFDTTATTDVAAIGCALKLWSKGTLPLSCVEMFLDLVAHDFVVECYENPSGEDDAVDVEDSSGSEASSAAGGAPAPALGPAPAGEFSMDIAEPEPSEPELISPWNPHTMTPALKKKITQKIKAIVSSSPDLKNIFLRLLETSPLRVLLIRPGGTTHMNALLETIRLLCPPAEDDDL